MVRGTAISTDLSSRTSEVCLKEKEKRTRGTYNRNSTPKKGNVFESWKGKHGKTQHGLVTFYWSFASHHI